MTTTALPLHRPSASTPATAPAASKTPPEHAAPVGTARATPSPPDGAPDSAPDSALRQGYLLLLGRLFAFFSTIRVLGYLPTLWNIVQSGDSSQHSLWTWFTWAGANLTMAGWLYEQQGQRWNRAVTVSLVNATMCVTTFVVILALRI